MGESKFDTIENWLNKNEKEQWRKVTNMKYILSKICIFFLLAIYFHMIVKYTKESFCIVLISVRKE